MISRGLQDHTDLYHLQVVFSLPPASLHCCLLRALTGRSSNLIDEIGTQMELACSSLLKRHSPTLETLDVRGMSSVMAAGTCTGEENALMGAAGILTVHCLLTLQLTQVL